MPDLRGRIEELKAKLDAASPSDLATVLGEGLASLVGAPYAVSGGAVIDQTGRLSQELPVFIHARVGQVPTTGTPPLVDNLAIALVVVDELTPTALADAYGRISSVKALAKGEAPKDEPGQTNATLGVIVARRLVRPVEDITDQLAQLNLERPSEEWPDVLCLGDKAVIEYCVQLPGRQTLSKWLPPSPGGMKRAAPAVYIVMVKTPSGEASFARVLGLIFTFLRIFRTRADLPKGAEAVAAAAGTVLPAVTYQYDLSGNLRPLRPDQTRRRLAPDADLRIVGPRDEPLAGLRYMPWQDGGAVIMDGKFPLEGLLMLGPNPENIAVLRPGDGLQVSYVMPMSAAQFGELLDQFQQKSNLRIERAPQKWVIRKVADEGTASPYVARLMLGLLTIRDAVIDEEVPARQRFDAKFELASQSLRSIRDAKAEIETRWREHEAAVREGSIVHRTPNTLQITAHVDRELCRECETFLTTAARLLKLNMQALASELGVDIGFMFKKQGAFAAGLTRLSATDPLLAQYMGEVRAHWSERLIKARIAIEHEGWMLPAVEYEDLGRAVTVREPQVAGEGVCTFADTMLDRLCCFMEDLTAHLLSLRLPRGMALAEVPPPRRDPAYPARFELTLADGGRSPWRIAYSEARFLER